ncbi:MAG: hypothetical protein UY23_C0001G0170 [Candidatus Jorgensenbacteria bacterium GW2011_GWA1_48_11]|uniref:Uncharacterized protein n=1 Tax=Candidatus Jorgensenbacteria bacterium GW2011_GWA1_48_11 TaxID=1618660 RepID=A0A0G1UBR1_9BACT|nr:MAG: hypothetical protein UY23_C0001G0170 [Candidatus Jorgensenbacteria bacterium GW2011_GWA1_48_11]KKW12057.1 MAG: hypothetical protein UY51_C0005G0299 [Candidatus Jorgensenbacteria bacterium GW2011_GWB1_49_9]
MGIVLEKTSNIGTFGEDEETDPDLDLEEESGDASPDEEEFEEDDFGEGKSEY